MKKGKHVWIIIVGAVVVLATGLMLMMRQPSGQPGVVCITVDGEEYGRYALDTDKVFTVQSAWGYNMVSIQGGAVDVYEADCPNQICVNTKPAKEIGDMIVCLPHKLVVEIVPGDGAP